VQDGNGPLVCQPLCARDSSCARRVEPRGLEPLTPCLQSKCATCCAMAPRSLSALVGGLSPSEANTASSVHPQTYVHCVCNQVGGTVYGLLCDGTDRVVR
jgi:hypothetical protein